jgi:hypothetical protein
LDSYWTNKRAELIS